VAVSVWLFSYGSNNPAQLAERLERPAHTLDPHAAVLTGYERVFRGMSRRWGGGTASLVHKPGARVHGYVAKVYARDLHVLDRFEGVGLGIYERRMVRVWTRRDEFLDAVVYVHTSDEFNWPSPAYLVAVAHTIASFWRNEDGSPVTPADIPVR